MIETMPLERATEAVQKMYVVLPNTKRLLDTCRLAGVQVVYPRIASLVKDCREVNIEHKRIKLLAPAGSRESDILEEIKPIENEIVLSKGASGVFNSTAIDQILRNSASTPSS
ncbi:isochorismatase family protein [Mesorhizobium abyssinicae]|nr:isochorismatase family protein [Mesorhizobium abyssinicae]MDX8437249.1 isochorismatase family protein [Mesorhizobium abyssinicae]